MKQKILFIAIILFLGINLNAQRIEKNLILPQLELTNNNLIYLIDSLIVQKEKKTKSFYFVEVTKDSINDIFVINIEKCSPPYISINNSMKGYFIISEMPFFLKESCNPDNLFKKTNKKRKFDYFVLKEYPKIITEPTYWNFFYVMADGIYYLNLPDELIRRWQFKPCK